MEKQLTRIIFLFRIMPHLKLMFGADIWSYAPFKNETEILLARYLKKLKVAFHFHIFSVLIVLDLLLKNL